VKNQVSAKTGLEIRCKGWRQEGILRMLENTIANGEDPENLIIYGSTGQAARNWESFHAIVELLQNLGDDETLVVQSGKPVAVFASHPGAPRVLAATSNLVPRHATREEFDRLRAEGLTIHGQYTAASWAYIGSQGIMQGTYETFGACAQRFFDGKFKGRIALSGGLGGMGSAQPMAVSMNGGVALIAEIDPSRIARRLDTGHIDEAFEDLDKAWARARAQAERGQPGAYAVLANAADVCEHFANSDSKPDCVTDQTSAHNLLHGYVPSGLTIDEARTLRADDPDSYLERSKETVRRHVRALLELGSQGVPVFEYGNDLRGAAFDNGVDNAFELPSFMPLFIRPSFARGRGPVRWVLLSGDVGDQRAADEAAIALFPDDEMLQTWLALAPERVPIEGLPARTCWLEYGARATLMLKLNQMVASGAITAPVAVTRDHLDTGACAFPRRETEGMPDGSDAIGDWPYLNAMLNVAGGADMVAIHQNGGDIGGSISAGMTVILDGAEASAERITRVFTTDPGIGVVRHADAGVPEAVAYLKQSDIRAGFVE
jgi:urocanate hydratase